MNRLVAIAVVFAWIVPARAVAQAPLYHSATIDVTAEDVFRSDATGSWGSPSPNPFLHVRLDVYFDHPSLGETIRVPGYFAGNGQGGFTGRVWRAHFTPALPGQWTWTAVLEGGQGLNAASPQTAGTLLSTTGAVTGELRVQPLDTNAPGFASRGFVKWSRGGRYYHYSQARAGRFVQCGVGSPENFLGYRGFSDAVDGGSADGSICCCKQQCFDDCIRDICADSPDPAPGFLHAYTSHVADWQDGDPDWSANGQAQAGRGIIGALNYLSDTGVNSLYLLAMNLGGDGKDTHPFLTNGGGTDCPITSGAFDPSHTLNYHVQRLEEWRTVLEHANDRGIMVHLLLAEQESCNIRWLGAHSSDGQIRSHMSIYRRLFMKQMVAHFGHLLALRWNLCEENKSSSKCSAGPSSCGTEATTLTPQFTAQELDAMARWIRIWDPADHPIGVHTPPNDLGIYEELKDLRQFPSWLSATSLQVHGEGGQGAEYEAMTLEAESLFEQAGFNVPILVDEQGSPGEGLASQENSGASGKATAEDRRKRVLYDVLLSGGQVSYYFGYYTASNGGGDLRTDDFRTRSDALLQLGFARKIAEFVRIWELEDADELVVNAPVAGNYGGPQVAKSVDGARLVAYYPTLFQGGQPGPSAGQIDLRQLDGEYQGAWVDPGDLTHVGRTRRMMAGEIQALPLPDLNGRESGGGIASDTDLLLILRRIDD